MIVLEFRPEELIVLTKLQDLYAIEDADTELPVDVSVLAYAEARGWIRVERDYESKTATTKLTRSGAREVERFHVWVSENLPSLARKGLALIQRRRDRPAKGSEDLGAPRVAEELGEPTDDTEVG